MAVVLRGGKWGAVASSSPADREDVSHHSDRQNDSESEHEAEGWLQTLNILLSYTLI